ncbi:MAG: protein tyrosine kinase, partial [Microcystaceae cyanobacterium]
QIAVLRSSSVLKPIVQDIQKQYPEVDYNLLAGGNRPLLAISQLKETKILEVAYLGIDRAQIEFVLNELAQAYLRYSLDERKVQINQGIKFVDDQLPKLREQVNRRQAQLQRFRQQYNLLDPEQRARELSELEFKLQAQYLDLQMALREAVSLNSLLKAQLGLSPDNAIASSFLSESPRYQNLLNELQAVELELVRESSRYSDDSPVVQTLKEKRA